MTWPWVMLVSLILVVYCAIQASTPLGFLRTHGCAFLSDFGEAALAGGSHPGYAQFHVAVATALPQGGMCRWTVNDPSSRLATS